MANGDQETKEDEVSLLRDVIRHPGWQHLRGVFEYGILQRQDAIADLTLITSTAWHLGIDVRDYTNLLRGEIRMLKEIIKKPERLAETLEEELRESAKEEAKE